MKSAKLKETKNLSLYTLPTIFFLMVFVLTLINQGGFFYGAIIFAMLLLSVGLFFIKPEFSKSSILFLVFCLWYFFCSVRNGFAVEDAIKGFLPMSVYFMHLITTDKTYSPDAAKKSILKLSVFLAIISVIICIAQTAVRKIFIDAVFPFWYANTTGLYFGICYILSKDLSDKFLDKYRFVFLLALVATRSVGAIVLTYLSAFIFSENKKKFVIFSLPIAVLAVFFKSQIVQSYASLMERFLQMHDGICCMIKNPVFGIGAGKWEDAKHVYQTGFYVAKVIHSSIIEIGVNSGFVGLILFVASLVMLFYRKRISRHNLLCLLMILIHSFIDFSLSFAAIGFLAVLCIPKEEETIETGKIKIFPVAGMVFCIFAFCILSTASVMNKSADVNINTLKPLSNVSDTAFERYLYELYRNDRTYEINELIWEKEYPTTSEILLLIKIDDNKEESIKTFLKKQPFNMDLRDALNLKDNKYAFEKMSYIGRKLYELKGENK